MDLYMPLKRIYCSKMRLTYCEKFAFIMLRSRLGIFNALKDDFKDETVRK